MNNLTKLAEQQKQINQQTKFKKIFRQTHKKKLEESF